MNADHLRDKYKTLITFRLDGGESPFGSAGCDDLLELGVGVIQDYVRKYKQWVRYKKDDDWDAHVVFAALGPGKIVLENYISPILIPFLLAYSQSDVEPVLESLNRDHQNWLSIHSPLDRCYLMGLNWNSYDNSPGSYAKCRNAVHNYLPKRVRELAREYIEGYQDDQSDLDDSLFSGCTSDTEHDSSNEVGADNGFDESTEDGMDADNEVEGNYNLLEEAEKKLEALGEDESMSETEEESDFELVLQYCDSSDSGEEPHVTIALTRPYLKVPNEFMSIVTDLFNVKPCCVPISAVERDLAELKKTSDEQDSMVFEDNEVDKGH